MEQHAKGSISGCSEGSLFFLQLMKPKMHRRVHLSNKYMVIYIYVMNLLNSYICFVGPFKIPSLNVPKKIGSGAWGIPHGTDAYHTSSDVSLFSSSLPVLPHEKCTHERLHYRSFLLRIVFET